MSKQNKELQCKKKIERKIYTRGAIAMVVGLLSLIYGIGVYQSGGKLSLREQKSAIEKRWEEDEKNTQLRNDVLFKAIGENRYKDKRSMVNLARTLGYTNIITERQNIDLKYNREKNAFYLSISDSCRNEGFFAGGMVEEEIKRFPVPKKTLQDYLKGS